MSEIVKKMYLCLNRTSVSFCVRISLYSGSNDFVSLSATNFTSIFCSCTISARVTNVLWFPLMTHLVTED